MIAWSKASYAKVDIERKIKEAFEPVSQIEISWDQKRFLENLKIFYSHSQMHCDEAEYNAILNKKINHCGNGTFTLFVYKDKNPVYDQRKTSSGYRRVNINVFDFKKELRKDLGGGHKIHASDNTFESNKDLTLLLGLNTEDYINQIEKEHQTRNIHKDNCLGVNGYENIEQLFYVLNNSIDYCVLRNYECLPKEYTLDGHGDIDLLVEDLNYIKYLTLACDFYPKKRNRVHYGIRISNQLIPFDFRYVGDDYYDVTWQLKILETYKFHNSTIKVPDSLNYFYSLLYHAYIHKKKVKNDYFERLINLSKKLNIDYASEYNVDEIKLILDNFLNQNQYTYTVPNDDSVYFNRSFLDLKTYSDRGFGNLISSRIARLDNEFLVTEVYEHGSEIVKCGHKLIIENEVKFLTSLSDFNFVPKILNYKLDLNDGVVIMEKLRGVGLNKAIVDSRFWTKDNIISFLKQILNINRTLIEHSILHRDIRPDNFLVDFDSENHIKLYLIDFGWACEIPNMKDAPTPKFLGNGYNYSEGNFSDIYSSKKIIKNIFFRFNFINDLIGAMRIKPQDYENMVFMITQINTINSKVENLKSRFTLKDYLLLNLLRNRKMYHHFVGLKNLLEKL